MPRSTSTTDPARPPRLEREEHAWRGEAATMGYEDEEEVSELNPGLKLDCRMIKLMVPVVFDPVEPLAPLAPPT